MILNIGNRWLSDITWRQINAKRKLRERLFEKFYNLKSLIKRPQGAPLIISFVAAVFFLCFLRIPLPVFVLLTRDEAMLLIGDRLTNLIVIFSITVSISVFILNAIQSRREKEEQITLLFEESYLYPVMYFTLSVIGLLICLTYVGLGNYIEDIVIIKMSALFMWLFLFTLIAIGVIFSRMYNFINTNYLLNKYLERIKIEAEAETLREIAFRRSRTIYKKVCVDNFPLKEDVWGLSVHSDRLDKFGIETDELVIIKDINVHKLKKILKKFLEPIAPQSDSRSMTEYYFKRLGLGSMVYTGNVLFNISVNDATSFGKKLRKVFKITKVKNV